MAGTRRDGNVGMIAAILAAILFGAGAPAAKALLGSTNPWLLAGVLYTASGLALAGYRALRRMPSVQLPRRGLASVAGAVLFGGAVGPVLLMLGLRDMPASGASLLLNAEGICTALIAWLVLKESTDRRIVLGFMLIAAGAVVLSAPGQASFAGAGPVLAVLGACLAWGIDNNLTGRVALTDATWLAMVKGLVAGPVNLVLALLLGAALPAPAVLLGGAAVGVLAYGVSLALFIVGMRHLGTARAGAYFSVAPFFGAVLAVLLGDPITVPLLVAGALMAAGIWLHVTERHAHRHRHEPVTHSHAHSHDDLHHGHGHGHRPAQRGRAGRVGTDRAASDVAAEDVVDAVVEGEAHVHVHTHAPIEHEHPHFPDAHHRHAHDEHTPGGHAHDDAQSHQH